MLSTSGRRAAIAAVLLLVVLVPDSALAQSSSANNGRITFVGGLDFANAYMFRGLRRDDTRVVIWPFVEAIADLHRTSDTAITLHIGTWNSLHTGVTGLQSSTGRMWYESDLYGTLGVAAGGFVFGATYTTYVSPNSSFSTIKELSFKVAAGDGLAPAGFQLKPYGLLAFELDAVPNARQADRGLNGGTYLELGVEPAFEDPAFTISTPIKIGVSLKDYYELAGVDHKFGYLSLGAIATVPFARSASYGTWNVHGGVEFQSLGDTPEAFNGGDQTKLIFAAGIGFRY